MSSSGAKGLFRAAIAQSPPVSMPWFTRKLYSERITPAIAAQVGCTSADEAQLVDCLLKADAAALVEAVPAATPDIAAALADFANAPGAPQPFLPMVDGPAGTIDGQLSALLASGSLPNKVPLLVGNVRDEGELCVGGRPESADAAASSSPLCPRSARTRAFSARSCRCVCCASSPLTAQAVFGAAVGPALFGAGVIKVDASNPDGVRVAISEATAACVDSHRPQN